MIYLMNKQEYEPPFWEYLVKDPLGQRMYPIALTTPQIEAYAALMVAIIQLAKIETSLKYQRGPNTKLGSEVLSPEHLLSVWQLFGSTMLETFYQGLDKETIDEIFLHVERKVIMPVARHADNKDVPGFLEKEPCPSITEVVESFRCRNYRFEEAYEEVVKIANSYLINITLEALAKIHKQK